jgi:glycerophosphoryl diester phosphodiesterase
MIPTRRGALALAVAAAAAPLAARAQAQAPIVIADGGAGAERPAGTAPAYELAIREGADFIAADLVASQDGALVVRRDHDISASTDVAARPEFAARRAGKTIDGQTVEGWFTEDFTLAELKTLTCREPFPRLAPAAAAFDGQWPILTFQEVIDLARAGSMRTARVIGVCATMTRPAYFASLGLQLEPRLADAVRAGGYNWPAAAMLVRGFEPGALKTFGGLSRVRRVQMLRGEGGPDGQAGAQQAGARYGDMTGADGLADVRARAEAIGPPPGMLLDLTGKAASPTDLAARAQAAGLAVYGWVPTAPALPAPHALLTALFAAGIDGLSCEDPGAAVKARRDALGEMRRRTGRRG